MNTDDARAAQLLDVGLDVAVRIRDEDPAHVRRALDGLDDADLRDLVVLLAACVPVEVPRSALLGWYLHPRYRTERPCGSRAAARRHRARGETVDPLCKWSEREQDRVRKREQRQPLPLVAPFSHYGLGQPVTTVAAPLLAGARHG